MQNNRLFITIMRQIKLWFLIQIVQYIFGLIIIQNKKLMDCLLIIWHYII
jgi:hypothetical protein